ncbi:transferase [Choanephora cucurbitarum]|nr:transferase [Choanephora cucurbitarum]
MVAFPPFERSFITSPKCVGLKPVPSPVGFSLVTSHVYTQTLFFFENVHHVPDFMNPSKIKSALEKTIEVYYPFAGRLIKKEKGRYDIGDFAKGVLFEVVNTADDFQHWKRHNFSYLIVPYEEMLSIKSYTGRDCPLYGMKLTFTKDGSCALAYSVHHKLADGVCLSRFISYMCAVSRSEKPDSKDYFMYTDEMRKPVKPLHGVNHNDLYPHCPPDQAPMLTVKPAPSRKLIFCFDKEHLTQFKTEAFSDLEEPHTKVSLFNFFAAFLHKAVTKARQNPPDSCSDLLCVVAQHHCHPDKKMINYIGNYILPIPISNTVQQVLDKSVCQIAKEINIACKSVTIPYMESLEYYFNTSNNVESIVSPISRLGYGAAGLTDWSRFRENYDFGYGHFVRMRSFVESSPIPLITIMPSEKNTIELVLQLDIYSIERLLKDRDFVKHVKCIH